ncbi:MAG TPA: hypothetical protein V6D19_12560 [Stenomitos sp.]
MAVDGQVSSSQTFKISPLIRFALWSFYVALVLPLPVLGATVGGLGQVATYSLSAALVGGAVLLHMALAEVVALGEDGIAVHYPMWVPSFLRREWGLRWSEVQDLKARSTGQGGLVYYLVARDGRGFLLPMRIAGFTRMVKLIHEKTGIDTKDIKPLAQPWMYGFLLVAAGFLAIADGWTLWTVVHGSEGGLVVL